MATNVWTMNTGQLGKALRGQLSDDSGPVDLSQFDSVSVQVGRTPTSDLLVDALAVIDADQSEEVFATVNGRSVSVSGTGWLTFTTEAEAAALATRTSGYLLSFKAMDGATPVYFPLNRRLEQTYGKLVVQEPLG